LLQVFTKHFFGSNTTFGPLIWNRTAFDTLFPYFKFDASKFFGEIFTCEIEVFNDARCPLGNMLACYLERGLNVGVSSRGVGDMELVMREGEDVYEVQDGFKFVTFDVVAEPSVAGTQLKQMNESLERRASKKQLKEAREKLLAKAIGRYLFD
jgi:hypothetical protein